MKAGTALLVALALLAVPSSANAGWRLDRAEAIAKIVWHHPCVDRMTIQWQSFSALDDPVLRKAVAYSRPAWCTVYMNTDHPLTWGDVCYEVLHEAGHLAGYRNAIGAPPFGQPPGTPRDYNHSPDPGSIMYPVPTLFDENDHISSNADARCHSRGLRFLHAHAAAGTLK